jgi:hypothetical protein
MNAIEVPEAADVEAADVDVDAASAPDAEVLAEERRRWVNDGRRSVAFHAVSTALALAALFTMDDPSTALRVASVIIGISCLVLLAWEMRHARIVVTPLTFLFVFRFLSLGAAGYNTGLELARGERIMLSIKEIPPAHTIAGFAIYLLSFLVFHAGIQAARPVEPGSPTALSGRFAAGAIALWTIGCVIKIFAPQLGFLANYARGTTAAMTATGLYLSADEKELDTRFWALCILGTVVEIILAARSGSKALIMYAFIPVACFFLVRRSLRVFVVPMLGALFALYIGVVMPVVMTARLRNESDLVAVYKSGDFGEAGFQNDLAESLDRQFESSPVAFLYGEVQRDGFKGGETLDYMKYAFVPRILWPEKPWVTQSAWFTHYLGFAARPDEATTATGMTAPGELYWNFGIVGVILGMLVLGCLMGLLWRITGAHPERDPLRMTLYMTLIFSVVDQAEAGATFVSLTTYFVAFGIPIAILDGFARRRASGIAAPELGPAA